MNRRELVLAAAVLVAVVVVVLVGFALGRSGDDSDGESRQTITATGTGKVEVVPDVAELSIGVSVTERTSRAARAAADQRMIRVLALLKARGIDAADIQTSQVSLSPNFGPTGATVVGFTATNVATARIRDLDAAGAILASAAGVGANQINGPFLIVSNEQAVYEKALEGAVANARAHAEAIASASGQTLGKMRAASEGSESGPIALESKAADLAATPIEPGTIEVQANVTATFDVD